MSYLSNYKYFLFFNLNTLKSFSVTFSDAKWGNMKENLNSSESILGIIYRGQADYGSVETRLDGWRDELQLASMRPGPAILPDDLAIMAYKERDREKPTDVLMFLQSFDAVTYEYLAILSLFVVALLLAFYDVILCNSKRCKRRHSIWKPRLLTKNYRNIFLSILRLLVKQNSYKPKSRQTLSFGRAIALLSSF